MLYHLALFAHIGGVLIYFIAIGLEVVVLHGLRRAGSVEQVRVLLRIGQGNRRLFPLALVLILGAGLYMTLTVWGIWTAWIDVALGALITLSALGPLVNARRFKAIGQAAGAAAGNAITADLRRRILDPVLRSSTHCMAAAALGIVFLMTLKPALPGALTTLAVAVMAGALWSLPMRRRDAAALSLTEHTASAEIA